MLHADGTHFQGGLKQWVETHCYKIFEPIALEKRKLIVN
jgi:hypothetical protein